ncbi:MAG: hypothetical protein ABI472_16390 [Ginsengibacter sp.]
MAAKINNAIADMKKYKHDYYLEFKQYFDGLEDFRIIRNDMSHCKGVSVSSLVSVLSCNSKMDG